MMLTMLEMTAADGEAVIVGKANCGVPTVKGKNTVYSGTPELMADYVEMAANAGVRIIGGCCGTAPEHVAAMREAMDNFEKGQRPSMDEVTAKLGALVNPPPKPGATGSRGNRRRR